MTDGGSSGRGGDSKIKKSSSVRKNGGGVQFHYDSVRLSDFKNVTSSVRDLSRSFKGSEKMWGPRQ